MADNTAPTTRIDNITETLHGVTLTDPYRWLEDGSSTETQAWVTEQNAHTRAVLDSLPGREALAARLTSLLSLPSIGLPTPRHGRYFLTRREGDQNQPVIYVREGLNGPERVLLDPNTFSDDGTVCIDWWYPTRDGKLVAYGTSANGDERSTLHVLEVETGTHRPDVIPNTRYASVGWLPDNSGFYYTRYPTPGTVPPGDENYYKKVYFHRLGDDPAQDPLLFGEDFTANEMPGVQLSPDGKWLLVSVNQGWAKNALYLSRADQGELDLIKLTSDKEALYGGQIVGDTLYLHTNEDAPNYKLLSVDLNAPEHENWSELIPECSDALEGVSYIGGTLIARTLRNATSRLTLHSVDGTTIKEITLPGLGTAYGPSGEWDGTEMFYGYTSYDAPLHVYRYDLKTDETTLWDKIEVPADLSQIEVNQGWYSSKDGTRVSLFVVHKRGLPMTGDHPTVLNGYGGFNISLTPGFSATLIPWLEAGGVYAVANLRGGAEYGEAWHRAGMKEKKQNVFDDFIAAAEYLIAEGYTNSNKLAITGGSNGGLLVGAALTQRPDLYRAVLCGVPLLDMVRYHLFQIAKLWVPEYGSAEDPEQFPYILAYSPYHHVEEGAKYPAILIETADSDSRVDPLHARKMAALLQAKTGSDRPILLRVDFKAGHGAGKPLAMRIEETVDTWSFLFSQLGATPA